MTRGSIVRDFRTLKALERKGFITCDGNPKSRERHWTGAAVRVITCHEGPRLNHWYDRFTHNGHEYQLQYFDGCFHPFVVRLDTSAPRPSFV